MIALWAAVAILGCVLAVLAGAWVHLARKVERLSAALTDAVELGDEEFERHDDILVEHDKQLTRLGDERLIGGGS